ncbi:tetratricopeptide repeat protein [Roseibium sediminis]|uniref:tetratricopeptide repeat protein n=1 Tax=Roseibium sediminis TaxID=1775174 RepID=UPI00123DE21B|nr:tetratricopeptide repeat protein [Roseibium sediminis]
MKKVSYSLVLSLVVSGLVPAGALSLEMDTNPILVAQSDMPDELKVAEEEYKNARSELGDADPQTAQALFALAQTLIGFQRFEDAEARSRELLALFERQYGADHPNTGFPLDLLATSLRGQGKVEEALKLREVGYERLVGHFGARHEMALQRARSLAIDYAELGRLEDAITVLDANMPHAMAIPPLYAKYLNTKAFVARESGGAEEAIPVMEQLVALGRKSGQDQSQDFASNLYNLATLYLDADRKQDALATSSEAGMIALQAYGPEHPATQQIFAFQTELRQGKERGEF